MSLLDTFIDADLVNPLARETTPPLVRREVWIAIRSDQQKGTGTPDDPYNGCTADKLDGLLSNSALIGANMTIRFGPGVFQTRGGYGPLHTDTTPESGVVGWIPKTGQKFVGSGISQTYLQLAKVKMQNNGATPPVDFGQGIPIIGASDLIEMDGFEISDMTLDCNASRLRDANGNPLLVAPYGIAFNRTRSVALRRVRVINVNGHTPTYVNGINQSTDVNPPGIGSWESYPVIVNHTDLPPGPLEYNSFVEDCIVDQPESSPARESTRINAHTHGGMTIRNCYLNGDYTTGSPYPSVPVVKMTYTATEVTVTTKFPHNLQIRDDVWIAGSPISQFNGHFPIRVSATPLTDYTFTFQKATSGNPGDPNGPNVTAELYVPPALLISSISLDSSNTLVNVTTPAPHRRQTGDWVRISGILSNSSPTNPLDNPFNGSFTIQVTGSNSFSYVIPLITPTPTIQLGTASWVDRWTGEDIKISTKPTTAGVLQDTSFWKMKITTALPHFKIAEIKLPAAGGFPALMIPKDYINIQFIIVNAAIENMLTGWFKVTKVESPRELVCETRWPTSSAFPLDSVINIENAYITASSQGVHMHSKIGGIHRNNVQVGILRSGPYHDLIALGTSPIQMDICTMDNYHDQVYFSLYEKVEDRPQDKVDRDIAERNLVTLWPPTFGYPNVPSNSLSGPFGLALAGRIPPGSPGFPQFPKSIIRKNIIRSTGPQVVGVPSQGVYCQGCQDLIVHYNVVNADAAHPVFCFYTTNPHTFENLTRTGDFLPGFDQVNFNPPHPDEHLVSEPRLIAETMIISI